MLLLCAKQMCIGAEEWSRGLRQRFVLSALHATDTDAALAANGKGHVDAAVMGRKRWLFRDCYVVQVDCGMLV